MKANVHAWHTEIWPTTDEVKALCKPGAGAETCVWLAMGADGWQCMEKSRPVPLWERWARGETNAKRDGCERVRDWAIDGLSGPVDVPS